MFGQQIENLVKDLSEVQCDVNGLRDFIKTGHFIRFGTDFFGFRSHSEASTPTGVALVWPPEGAYNASA
jgi:hypothetical protein